MKNFTYLRILMVMSLAISSTSIIEAYNGSMKYTNKTAKNCSKKRVASMNEVEDRLHAIKDNFKATGDAVHANQQLDKIATELPCVVAKMRRNEEHIKLWKTHKHTLERKLQETREFVNERAN